MSLDPKVELAPFRTLTDFVTDAQFSAPAVTDNARWYNRVKQNLLYYQTNYFLMIALMVVVYSALNVPLYFTGVFVTTIVTASLSLRSQYGLAPAGALAFAAGLMGYLYAVFYMFASIAIPCLAIFGHASFRTRNVKNKMNSAVETLRIVPTPMGQFLECIESCTPLKSLAAQEKK